MSDEPGFLYAAVYDEITDAEADQGTRRQSVTGRRWP